MRSSFKSKYSPIHILVKLLERLITQMNQNTRVVVRLIALLMLKLDEIKENNFPVFFFILF